MSYTLLKMHTLPMVYFAHCLDADVYEYTRLTQYSHFEISYFETGNSTHKTSQETVVMPEGSLKISIPGEQFTLFSHTPHRHLTCAFVCKYELSPISEEEIAQRQYQPYKPDQLPDCYEAILPDYLPPSEETGKIAASIKQIIKEYYSTGTANYLLSCAAPILSVLAFLTEISRNQVLMKNQNPANIRYVKKATQYIASHIDEKINVDQIAYMVGLSNGYLSSIFKSVTGQSLIQYINRMKINKITELLKLHDITLQQAGEMVGIEDAHYLSRLFKQIHGISYRDYMEDYKRYGIDSRDWKP